MEKDLNNTIADEEEKVKELGRVAQAAPTVEAPLP